MVFDFIIYCVTMHTLYCYFPSLFDDYNSVCPIQAYHYDSNRLRKDHEEFRRNFQSEFSIIGNKTMQILASNSVLCPTVFSQLTT